MSDMTRAEAIKILSECKEKGFKHTFYTLDEYHTAMDIAINSLRIDEQYDLMYEQAEPKTGHWILGICDNCGYDWGKDAPIASVPNFCPNCGAKMEGCEEA